MKKYKRSILETVLRTRGIYKHERNYTTFAFIYKQFYRRWNETENSKVLKRKGWLLISWSQAYSKSYLHLKSKPFRCQPNIRVQKFFDTFLYILHPSTVPRIAKFALVQSLCTFISLMHTITQYRHCNLLSRIGFQWLILPCLRHVSRFCHQRKRSSPCFSWDPFIRIPSLCVFFFNRYASLW